MCIVTHVLIGPIINDRNADKQQSTIIKWSSKQWKQTNKIDVTDYWHALLLFTIIDMHYKIKIKSTIIDMHNYYGHAQYTYYFIAPPVIVQSN